MHIILKKELDGNILDIGGGGEGVIGQIYGKQVIAIDNRQDELDGTPGECKKLLMDATDLQFKTASFDHVTSFFTLMYMDRDAQKQAVNEAVRVLRAGGRFHIWDTNIESAYPEPFVVDLDIDASGKHIYTTYGIGKLEEQNMGFFIELCEAADMRLLEKVIDPNYFYLQFKKEALEEK